MKKIISQGMVVLLLMACNASAANYTGRTIKAKMA